MIKTADTSLGWVSTNPNSIGHLITQMEAHTGGRKQGDDGVVEERLEDIGKREAA